MKDIKCRKLRIAMVGGGPGAGIGRAHRSAALMDGEYELVAGAFSSNPEKSKSQGQSLYLAPDRSYGSWEEMLETEDKAATWRTDPKMAGSGCVGDSIFLRAPLKTPILPAG